MGITKAYQQLAMRDKEAGCRADLSGIPGRKLIPNVYRARRKSSRLTGRFPAPTMGRLILPNTMPFKPQTPGSGSSCGGDVMVQGTLRHRFDDSLGAAEMGIYAVLALLLSATILAAIASACKLLFDSVIHWTVATQTLRVLNELLIVLMLAEILHTVRISIRSHVLVTEPFLVVGLIASIRRILVISLEMATLGREGTWTGDSAVLFRHSMIELGLLSLLVLVLVFSITLLRRYPPTVRDVKDA
jgi:hypothetical protein